ncbi:MAG: M14 family zinc carboxypeptidase, partial [Emcibacteraceae bacterium]|nr:M14 family zinc carboxypeptidase [Emcibacteraceae bacterium]
MVKIIQSALVIIALFTCTTTAQEFKYIPDAEFDAAIPTVEQVLGYKSGDEITSHGDMVKYFEALAKAAPMRVKIFSYGKTWENRPLMYVAISNADNIAKLSTLSRNMKKLADPRVTSKQDADAIIAETIGTTWLSHGVHGNEIAPMEASMQTAYHLLATTNMAQIDNIMRHSVTFIDPQQNPDGRDRFIHTFRESRGLMADSSSISAEHKEPWPNGRVNHYLFDLNRDWFALTQPESQGKVAALQEYFPLVYIDLHEMGGNSSFFFSPPAPPKNPNVADNQWATLEMIGRSNASYFDKYGFEYFTREVFDAFYPGYGASWPAYFGAASATYEQASSGGLLLHRNDGETLHYRDAVRHHLIASLSTAEVVATNREKLLNEFYEYRRSGIEEGTREDNRYYIIPTQNDQAAADKIAGLLTKQGVDVEKTIESFRSCGVTYEAGSYVIDSAQPVKRFLRTIMDENVAMDVAFIEEQERRRNNNLRDQIYDVTAWSLPHLFNVKMDRCNSVPNSARELAGEEYYASAMVSNLEATVAFIVPWGQSTASRFLSHALRQGLVVKSADMSFVNLERRYPAGSLVIEVKVNEAGLSEKIAKIAHDTGAEVVGVNDSWVSDGPSFGSGNTKRMHAPKVAILWDTPTANYSAGNTRFVIERQFDYPVTAIRSKDIVGADLSPFQVLIIPESRGGYKDVFGEQGAMNLKKWVNEGGTLIALGTGMHYVTDPDVDLMSVRREYAYRAETQDVNAEGARVDGVLMDGIEDYNAAIEDQKANPDVVPGVMLKAKVDLEHWLTAGSAETLNVLYRGSDIYTPVTIDKGRNVVNYLGAEEVLASGYLWEENRVQLAHKPFIISEPKGRGQVIGFTSDPTVRAYLDGLNLMLI